MTCEVPVAYAEAVSGLMTEFAWCADRGEGRDLAALFLPVAVLEVGGSRFEGAEAIADDCYRRASIPGRKTRHLWSNLRFESFEDDELNTVAVQLTFEGNSANGESSLRVNDIHDRFRRDETGRWRFASRLVDRQIETKWPVAHE